MKYNVILFDADGITIMSERFSARMEKDHGTPWEVMKPFFEGPFIQCTIGKADLKIELQKVLLEWNWTRTVEELMDYWFNVGVTINTDVIDLVTTLREKGITCYLATNQTAYRANYLRNDLGLGKVFDGLYVSADLGHMKNEPVFFKKIIDDQNQASTQSPDERILSEQILFIDDEEKNLLSAQEAGLATYCYKDFDSLKTFLLN